ncbi:MAG: hypothetical protein B0D82_00255 [Candidatus Sedimenticola endophacoides]|nr:MAG: hypothetical protein B0D82_00255 [Candidatus Sedimenticola endophacoides]
MSQNLSRGSDTLVISLLWDITEKKQNEELIARQANFDTLSGLPNRRMLGELLDREIARLGWRGGRLALMYIDLDLFKEVNDSLGHGVGDRLLAEAWAPSSKLPLVKLSRACWSLKKTISV